MRGEYTKKFYEAVCCVGSPPHARGIRAVIAVDSVHQGITPACAGNTFFIIFSKSKLWDHPRMRGEYYRQCVQV